jgi:hypothetical protein
MQAPWTLSGKWLLLKGLPVHPSTPGAASYCFSLGIIEQTTNNQSPKVHEYDKKEWL